MFRFRLRHVIVMMTWSLVSGAVLVAAFSAGWYGWMPVALAVGLGLAIGWPLAAGLARRIKRADPHYDADRDRPLRWRDSPIVRRLPNPWARR